jgi:transcriptional regulator with XRE-family HTH domain
MTTLHELFAKYHIHRPVDLAKRVGLSRQYAHLLWTGHRPISRRMAERIAEATKIPYTALLTAIPPTPPPRKPRKALEGRPSTPPEEDAHDQPVL